MNHQKVKGRPPRHIIKAGDIRLYANNTLILTAPAGESITAISFTLSTQGKKQTAAIAADEGIIATQSKGAATIDWSGNIDKITFTVGAKTSSALQQIPPANSVSTNLQSQQLKSKYHQ